jgi:hypothetical protein
MLGHDGSHVLILEGDRQLQAQAQVPFSFTLNPISTEPLAITLGQANPGGGPLWTDAANGGQALVLRGAEHLTLPHSADLELTGNVTLEAWVKFDRFAATWTPVLSKADGLGGRTYDLWVQSNGSIAAYTTRSTGALESAQSGSGLVSTGAWVHLAAVFDRATSEQRLYVNGELVRTEALQTTIAQATGGPLLVGWSAQTDTSIAGLEGAIGDIRIWGTARSTDQIAQSLGSRLTGTEDGLRLYLPLDGALDDAGPVARTAGFVSLLPDGITGQIASVGQERTYSFTLDAPSLIYLDSMTNRNDLRYALTGPQGVVVDRHLAQSDASGSGSTRKVVE